MGVKHEYTSYTADDLRHLASRLRFYAEKYESVGERLEEIKVPALGLPNEKSLGLAMESLRRHVAEAETTLGRVLDTPPSRMADRAAEPAELYLTPVGKGKTKPVITPKTDSKSDSGQKKRAE